jgi:hypothetical protein
LREIKKIDYFFFSKAELTVEELEEVIREIKEEVLMKINKLSDVLPAMVVTKTSFEKIFSQNSSLEQR